MSIKKVIICGLGALGLTYANKLKDVCELKILADNTRIEKYRKNPPTLNGKLVELDYINPQDSFDADLIIITTKSLGLNSAIEYIKNFVNEKTIIISLINGISSEDILFNTYKNADIIRSYFIGHSAMRTDSNVIQDGIGKIVIEKNSDLESFFQKNQIDYESSNNIIYSQWVKLGVNIILNQPSAIYRLTVGELRNKDWFLDLAKNLIYEITQVANACGYKDFENYEKDVLKSVYLIADDGKTSMYQDVIAKRKTEVDIFSGEIIKLGEKYNIKTPHNLDIYNKIKSIEESF